MSRNRHEEILKLLSLNNYMKVEELCEALNVSPATIRRDLSDMEGNGLLKRICGGATVDKTVNINKVNSDPLLDFKQRIAKKAIDYVTPGSTIFIDSGSTNNEIARLLTNFSDISVITNSINIAYMLYNSDKRISVCVCGGNIGDGSSPASIVGTSAEMMISQFRANILFLGTSGIHPKYGITDPFLQAASIKIKMVENSSKVILVTDHTKFGKINKAFVCPIEKINHIITDTNAPTDDVQYLRQHGTTIDLV